MSVRRAGDRYNILQLLFALRDKRFNSVGEPSGSLPPSRARHAALLSQYRTYTHACIIERRRQRHGRDQRCADRLARRPLSARLALPARLSAGHRQSARPQQSRPHCLRVRHPYGSPGSAASCTFRECKRDAGGASGRPLVQGRPRAHPQGRWCTAATVCYQVLHELMEARAVRRMVVVWALMHPVIVLKDQVVKD